MPSPAPTLLVVDDDTTGLRVNAFNLRRAGFRVEASSSGEAALDRFDPARHAMVITDLKMPGVDGLQVIEAVRQRAPQVPVIVVTAFGSVDSAVRAMQAGAWDYIEKPFPRERLELTARRALESARLKEDNRRLRAAVIERPVIATSEAMREVLRLADRVAPTRSGVLITGESDTGKELIARRVHARSPRLGREFVAVNCAAIPAELLESEMFGHTRGAFSGAQRARRGRFRAADGGTLFLDEVAEMAPALQAKLLRVLEEGLVDVVGADKPERVDVRVIAATNKDLEARVEEGRFRRDLYFRLNAFEIHLPPLRERPEDIAALARHFLDEATSGRELDLPAAVEAELRRRPWPGNVRELRNACERVALLATGARVDADDLPPPRGRARATNWLDHLPAELSLMDLEAEVIRHALRRNDWNLSGAARRLGVPRHILAYRVEKFGITRDDEA